MPAANPLRGEAFLGAHKIVVDFNGLCALEDALDMKVPDILVLMESGLSFSALRTCIRVFSVTDVTDEDVGKILNDIGYVDALSALSVALGGFFAPVKEQSENPLKAA